MRLEKIQTTLHAQMVPARDAERALLTVLADGVAAGKIDAAQADMARKQLAVTATGIHAACADALNQLHALLTIEERRALIEKVRAHWEVWQSATHDEEADPAERDRHLAKIAASLSLTPDQVATIRTALGATTDAPDLGEAVAVQAHIDALAAAFVSDSFDARSLGSGDAANGYIAKAGPARMVHFYEVVTPLLTAEQRAKLVNHLHQRLLDGHTGAAGT